MILSLGSLETNLRAHHLWTSECMLLFCISPRVIVSHGSNAETLLPQHGAQSGYYSLYVPLLNGGILNPGQSLLKRVGSLPSLTPHFCIPGGDPSGRNAFRSWPNLGRLARRSVCPCTAVAVGPLSRSTDLTKSAVWNSANRSFAFATNC